MTNPELENLIMAKISKEGTRDGLATRAEQLANQLETTLQQINEINAEIEAIHELQTKSSDNPETQDHTLSSRTATPPDLEPVNHPED